MKDLDQQIRLRQYQELSQELALLESEQDQLIAHYKDELEKERLLELRKELSA